MNEESYTIVGIVIGIAIGFLIFKEVKYASVTNGTITPGESAATPLDRTGDQSVSGPPFLQLSCDCGGSQ